MCNDLESGIKDLKDNIVPIDYQLLCCIQLSHQQWLLIGQQELRECYQEMFMLPEESLI